MYIRSGRSKNKARNAEHCGRDARAIMNLTLQIYKIFLFVLHNHTNFMVFPLYFLPFFMAIHTPE